MTLVSSHHSLRNALPWLPLFSSFTLCTRRTKQLQVSINCDMKYLQKEWRLIPTNFGCFSFSFAQSQLWNIYLEVTCVPVLNLPSSTGNQLQMEGLKFCEKFMINSSVPNAIAELTRFKCKKGSKTNSSSCKRANLVCTDSCSCNINDDCKNTNHYKLYESFRRLHIRVLYFFYNYTKFVLSKWKTDQF